MAEQINYLDWKSPNSYVSKTFAALPTSAGVYLLVRATWFPEIRHQVLYVGMSTNLQQRLKKHEIKALCEEQDTSHDYVQIFFKELTPAVLRAEEKRLIALFNPPFNLQHRMRGI